VEQGDGPRSPNLLKQTVPLLVCNPPRHSRSAARMWAAPVVVTSPCFDDLARLRQAREHVLVQTLVAQSAVEAFEGILHRLARLDVVSADPISHPPEHRNAGEFSPVIA
jgi:hypothetical protein